jgi:hypothetical protein
MSDAHAFCRVFLADARKTAKEMNTRLPKGLVALHSSGDTWFVQGHKDKGRYVTADCAYHAKAKAIQDISKEQSGIDVSLAGEFVRLTAPEEPIS